MMDFLSNLLGAVKNVFGFLGCRSELKNSKAMQDNAAAATRQRIAEQAAKDVLDGSNLDQLRKDASEP